MLTRENFQFARQAGATHIVAHLVDYFKGRTAEGTRQPAHRHGARLGIGRRSGETMDAGGVSRIAEGVEAEGLKLEAIENFDPAHWHDVLLDGPKKLQLENL